MVATILLKKYLPKIWLILALILSLSCHSKLEHEQPVVFSAPSGERFTEIVPEGETVIPNGRIVTPAGRTFRVAPHPYGLTRSQSGKIVVTANSGTKPFSLSIIHNPDQDSCSPELAKAGREVFKEIGSVLGLFQSDPAQYFAARKQEGISTAGLSEADIQGLIDERLTARKEKNWARADEIRDELAAKGIILKDTTQGTEWSVK